MAARQIAAVLLALLAALPLSLSLTEDLEQVISFHPLLQPQTLDTLAAFEAVTGYNYTLSEEVLSSGVNVIGSDHRLRRFLLKWLSGQQVKLGVVGGSISAGSMASHLGKTDYFSLLGKFLDTAHASAKAKWRNGAVSATRSSYAALCLDNHVDADVDLLLLDYTLNDGYSEAGFVKSSAKVYEQLVRKILALPAGPAVFPVMMMKCCARDPEGNRTVALPFFRTVEAEYSTLHSYYDLSSVSVRNALYHKVVRREQGFAPEDIFGDGTIHPNDAGMKMITDLIVFAIQRALRGLTNELTSAPRSTEEDGEGAALMAVTPTPHPIFKDNFHTRTLMCVTSNEVNKYVVDAEGWKYGYESGHGQWAFNKWGYITTTVGSKMLMQVSTKPSKGDTFASNLTAVYVGYLKSYQHMGTARVECVSGCECEGRVVNAHHSVSASQTFLVRLLATQHDKCLVQVTVLPETSSSEHKFKVTSLMVVEYTPSTLDDGTTRRRRHR